MTSKKRKVKVEVWIELYELFNFSPTIHWVKPSDREITTSQGYGNLIVPATITYSLPTNKRVKK